MGIDKADVRYVIHYDLPKTIESYYQETGRAGRDGKSSECVLLFSRGDYGRVRWMLENDNSTGQHLKIGLRKLQEMVDYCESSGCRRKFLLNYFGEKYEEDNCASCDNCAHPRRRIDGTGQAILIARCVHQLPSAFGIDLIADVLRGSRGAKIKEYGFETLPSYGTGKHYSKPEYRSWINEMVRQGLLVRAGEKYPVISLAAKGEELLRGKIRVILPVEGTETTSLSIAQKNTSSPMDTDDEILFLRLKSLRRTIAERDAVPAYMVFPDSTLREMSRIHPCSRESFATINGVGGIKLDKFGPEFIAEIKKFSQKMPDE
jgi:ATP-dependent DNA helicase RecQ